MRAFAAAGFVDWPGLPSHGGGGLDTLAGPFLGETAKTWKPPAATSLTRRSSNKKIQRTSLLGSPAPHSWHEVDFRGLFEPFQDSASHIAVNRNGYARCGHVPVEQ